MQNSQAIARLAGPIFAAVALGMLTSPAAYREMAGQFIGAYPYIYFSGILLLAAGLTILNSHHEWTRDWRSSITALGWVMTCIGCFRIIAPPFVAFIGASLFAKTEFFIGAGIVFFVFGAFLTYKGYVA